MGEIPRSSFQFDFELEKKILAEAEKENPNWVKFGLENLPSRPMTSTPSAVYHLHRALQKELANNLYLFSHSFAVS